MIYNERNLFVLLNEYADWEASYLSTLANESGKCSIKTVSLDKGVVKSIGGFYTNIDYTIEEACNLNFSAVILVGGYSWRIVEALEVKKLVNAAKDRGSIIGAICDATVFLGSIGMLNDIKHTSNTLENLKAFAKDNYTGENNYIKKQAVSDAKVITANGTATLEFTKEIIKLLDVMSIDELDKWYDLHKYGYIKE